MTNGQEQWNNGTDHEAHGLGESELTVFVVRLHFGQDVNGRYVEERAGAEEHAQAGRV